jgi:uncharacterized glyoxalase superfamily protein PhnB
MPTPCLWFDTQGEDAARFYTSLFPNSRIVEISRYGETNPRQAGQVMVVRFELDGQTFMALNGGPSTRSARRSRSRSTAPTRPRSTATGRRSPRAARRARAGGSKTGSACHGRSCRPA